MTDDTSTPAAEGEELLIASGGLTGPGAPIEVGKRTGAFGVHGSGDTSGFGGLVEPILFPGASARPYGSYFDEIADNLERALVGGPASYAEAIERVVIDRDQMTLVVRREHLVPVCQALRDDPALRFEMCTSVSGVHFPADSGRELQALYQLLSITHGARRVTLQVVCPDADPHIPSVVAVYPMTNWHERETWDFFGIVFDGHPALTRILMPDDWPGHPQRKDYPLGGIPVEYKGAFIPAPDERRQYS